MFASTIGSSLARSEHFGKLVWHNRGSKHCWCQWAKRIREGWHALVCQANRALSLRWWSLCLTLSSKDRVLQRAALLAILLYNKAQVAPHQHTNGLIFNLETWESQKSPSILEPVHQRSQTAIHFQILVWNLNRDAPTVNDHVNATATKLLGLIGWSRGFLLPLREAFHSKFDRVSTPQVYRHFRSNLPLGIYRWRNGESKARFTLAIFHRENRRIFLSIVDRACYF